MGFVLSTSEAAKPSCVLPGSALGAAHLRHDGERAGADRGAHRGEGESLERAGHSVSGRSKDRKQCLQLICLLLLFKEQAGEISFQTSFKPAADVEAEKCFRFSVILSNYCLPYSTVRRGFVQQLKTNCFTVNSSSAMSFFFTFMCTM